MQFKLATVVAVASALLSPAQASVAARQNDPCPQSGVSCGWFLLNSASNSPCTPDIEARLRALNPNANIFNSQYQITNGVPTAWVRDCTANSGCSRSGVNPSTAFCNA